MPARVCSRSLAHDFRQIPRRGEDGGDGLRINGVGGNAEVGEGNDRVEAIQTFRCEHQIRVQIGDGFEAGVDGAADFGFVLGVRGKIAIVGVADEEILQAEGVNGFGDAWGEGNDAVQSLWNADGTADLVGDFAEGWLGRGCRNASLCRNLGATQWGA
jgi:hypothetical protein